MCGRFGFAETREVIKKRFQLDRLPDPLPQLYNIAPTEDVPVILNADAKELQLIRWGLIPAASPTGKPDLVLINAKAETLNERPTFRKLLPSKRCLILADCFYEWQKLGKERVPFRFTLQNDQPFAFAGLYDVWSGQGRTITSCTIITVPANELVAQLHDRMPCILKSEHESRWLTGEDPKELLVPVESALMKMAPASKLVNSVSNKGPDVVQP